MPATPVPPMPPMPPTATPPVSVPPAVTPPPMGASPVPGEQPGHMHKTGNDACIKRLRQMNVESAPKVYVKPVQPGTLGKQLDVQTNIFGIEVSKPTEVFQYVIHAKADLRTNKEVTFTKKGKEDFVVLDRHEKCCEILFHAVEHHPDFFKMHEGNQLIYDGQSTLFTTSDLFKDVGDELKKTHIIEVDGSKTKNIDLHNLPCIILEIWPSKNGNLVISSENLGNRTADTNISANNRAYSQFMELALNQNCVRETTRFGCFEHGKVYFLQPTDEGFSPQDCVDVGDGKSLLPGLKKTIQFIEGPYGRGQNNPSIVIDAMKAAFHKEQCVMDKLGEIINKDPTNGLYDHDREKAFQVIKNLDCYTTYTGRTRHLRIDGIHHDNPATAKFELPEGETITVADYYQTKYKITLKYPKANLIVCKERGNKNFYPPEVLTVTKNQRVTIPQQTGAQSQRTTKECAVLPDVRQRLIVTGKNATQINENNPLLQHFGIKVYPEPLLVQGRELEGKSLCYAGREVKSEFGKWRSPPNNFLQPATMSAVWAMYAVGTQSSRFTAHDIQSFVQQFVDTCKRKGMKMSNPADFSLISSDKIMEKLDHAIRSNCKFIFVITDDAITHLHQKFKMMERETGCVIQDMKMSKATTVIKMGKKLTLENIINKTNVKLGGLNYVVSDAKNCMSDEQLIIGIGISNPPAGTKFLMEGKGYLNPLIIGYASNGKATHEFVGDFTLAPMGQDTMASIEDILTSSLDLFKKNRESLPKRIIVYRSGVSEGAHPSIIAFEVPLARAVIATYGADIKLIYMVVTKDHTYRFFNKDLISSTKATEQNIQSGLVLDSSVTHPACKQFFLNSHTTLQGTAKTPLYTVLADDCNAGMDRLEELTYTLCHHHQIVTLTTSVPTPLYVANEYAKRGRALWIERTEHAPVEGTTGSERERLQELSSGLCYKYTPHHDKRINA